MDNTVYFADIQIARGYVFSEDLQLCYRFESQCLVSTWQSTASLDSILRTGTHTGSDSLGLVGLA